MYLYIHFVINYFIFLLKVKNDRILRIRVVTRIHRKIPYGEKENQPNPVLFTLHSVTVFFFLLYNIRGSNM